MEISSTEAQNNFGRYLKLSQFEEIIITKNGKKAAVIKHYEDRGKCDSVIAEKAENYGENFDRITYEDFMQLSRSSENRYEFIDGEVYMLTSPSYDHQCIVVEVLNVLSNYFKGRKCRPLTAPFDVTITIGDNRNVVQPDIIVICDRENIDKEGRYTGVPTLVVEVLSRSTQKRDMLKKLNLYLHAGIEEYWIVNPMRKEIYIYCFAERDIKEYRVYLAGQFVESITFEGLSIDCEAIFAGVSSG